MILFHSSTSVVGSIFYRNLTVGGSKNDRVKIKDEHKNSNSLWGMIKEMTNTRTKVPPRMVIHDGNIFTSIKQMKCLFVVSDTTKLVFVVSIELL